MKRGGNELFRIGIAPFEKEVSLPINVNKTIPIQQGQFTGSFFYRLNRSAISQGFFWKHNGPTADLYYFKVMMIKKTDDTNISYFSNEQKGADIFYNALESACYEDFDYPLLGFDILVDEVACKRFALSEAALLSQVTLLLNFALSRMVGEKYFDIYERKNE